MWTLHKWRNISDSKKGPLFAPFVGKTSLNTNPIARGTLSLSTLIQQKKLNVLYVTRLTGLNSQWSPIWDKLMEFTQTRTKQSMNRKIKYPTMCNSIEKINSTWINQENYIPFSLSWTLIGNYVLYTIHVIFVITFLHVYLDFVAEEYIQKIEGGRTNCACTLCGKDFIQKSDAKRHVIAKHSGIQQQVSCTICGKTFKNPQTVKSHMRQTHGCYSKPN